MSDLAAAAAAMGIPEELVERSAAARASAQGVSVEEVLAAWAGGTSAPATAPAQPAEPAPSAEPAAEPAADVAEPTMEPEQAEPVATPSPAEPAAPAAAAPIAAASPETVPVLSGERASPWGLLAGVAALFALAVLLGVVLPAVDARDEAQAALPGAEPSYGEQALDGRKVYVNEGCWYCHTRQVRPISTDFGLGRVSLPGTYGRQAPDVFGTVRVGPDLARAGTREPTDDAAWIASYLGDPSSLREGTNHPPYAYLSDADLRAVAQFLVESR